MDIFGVNNPGFDINPFTDAEMIVLESLGALGDPGADRIVFWDESANAFAYLTPGTGLSISGTTLNVTGAALADGDYGDITASSGGTVLTIDNGVVTNAKVASGIDAVKIADGSISNTEFQYLNNVSSNIQTQLDAKQVALSGTGFVKISGTTISYDNSTYLTTASAASTYQPLDGDLTALAALSGTNTIYYRSAANTWTAVTVGSGLDFTGGTLSAVGGSGGTVDAVVAGTGIDVDDTDPANPIVALDAASQASLALADSAVQDLSDLGITASAAELNILDGATLSTTELNYVDGVTSSIQTQIDGKQAALSGTGFVKISGTTISYDNSTYLTTAAAAAAYQPLDSDLTTLAGLTPTTDNFIVAVSSAWASRTPAQVRTTLGLVIGTDVLAFSAYDDATAAETNTGTSTAKYVSPDGLAGSYAGMKSVSLYIVEGTTDVTTGDGKAYFVVPSSLTGMNLVRVHARVITAGTTGTTDIQIANVTDGVDILSTKLTIDSTETGSDTAATPAVINTSNDDVATNDLIRIDIDAVSTTKPKGLIVTLEFQLP